MPSPTPPREVKCIACNLPRWLHPIPKVRKPEQASLYVRVKRHGIVIPGCTGCGFPEEK
jgi:hypothetical protein